MGCLGKMSSWCYTALEHQSVQNLIIVSTNRKMDKLLSCKVQEFRSNDTVDGSEILHNHLGFTKPCK